MNFCTKEQERSIKTIIKRFFRKSPNGDLKNLESLISAELGVKDYKLNDFLTEDITKLLNFYGVELSVNMDSTPSFKSNVIDEISSFEIDDLFHGLNLAKLYFDRYVNGLVVKNFWIGYGDSYVNNNEDLTKNFLNLKNDLFRNIQSFLINNNVIDLKKPLDLYNKEFQVLDYDHYKTIMKKVSDYFFDGNKFSIIKSYSGKSIPNISINMDSDSDIYEAYFNMILLSNFDTVIKKDYDSLVNVNELYYNELTTNMTHSTYQRVFKPESTLYWSNETHMEEGVESQNVKLAEMIVNSIPAYDKINNKTLNYMEMKDFYLLGSVIANFELLHGNKLSRTSNFKYFSSNISEQFEWYVNTLKDVLDGKVTNDLLAENFEKYSNIIYSLYNYINDPSLDILNKEKNSDLSLLSVLGQILNNTFGASYTVIDVKDGITVQQIYSQDFNSTGLNNTIYSKMAANSYNKNYYNLADPEESLKLNELFKNIDTNSSAKDLVTKNRSFLRKLRKYTYDKLGFKLSDTAIKAAMESMENTPGAKGVFTIGDLKEKYKELLYGLHEDFTSDNFKRSLDKSTKATKFDSSIGKLVESTINKSLFKAFSMGYLINSPIKSVMNIKTLDGKSIPAYKIPTLTYKDTELFQQQREYEKNTESPKTYKSLLIKDSPAIIGTSTKLELTNNKKNKSANEYYPIESFLADINYEFLDNIVQNKKFNVMIGAYSDKSTIVTKIIDAKYSLENEKEPILSKDIDSILEIVRSQSHYYYYDTVNTVIDSYKELFNILGILPNDVNLSINNLDKSVEFINKVLSENNIDELVVKAKAPHIKITSELHYSRYAEGISLNQLLFDNYKIFSNETLFKEFVKKQEKSLLDNYNHINKTIEGNLFSGDLTSALSALNINRNNYKGENFRNLTLNSGELNPIVKKWMWLNALYRNEYLYVSTKGEYMHPIKGFHKRNGDFNDDYWNSYLQESSLRLSVMSKRNVTNTSTYEAPIRDSKYGVPTKLNMAAIHDYQASPYSITGERKYKVKDGEVQGGQDAHDGSTFIDYTYSMMIDASYPGKGYSGTKKQFGTIITEGGVIIKKDAESVLTNRKIRNSLHSSISGIKLKEKMLSIPIGDVNLKYDTKLKPNYFYNDRGKLYRIGEIQLNNINGKNILTVQRYQKIKDNWIKQNVINYPVNNLFDIWTAFGGAYSTDINGNFNESSNELLYKVITDNVELKSKLIHILANKSALKAGATNLNPNTSWTNNTSLAYATFSSRFMGPQLDASHSADKSEIKEITQIISAMAQGGFTSDIAREAYKDIQNLIEDTAKSYIDSLNSSDESQLYKFLTSTFIKSITQSKGNNIAKVLLNNLKKDGIKIPFSNANFYNAFVKELITKMNTDFISRYYPGLGAILVPSQGMIQLYDITLQNGEGASVTQEELIKEALESYDEDSFIQRFGVPAINNYQIIQDYLNRTMPNISVKVDEIEIGDTVLWDNKEKTLITPDDYYDFKESFNNSRNRLILKGVVDENINNVVKVQSKPRELKPTLHTFYTPDGEKRNVFDLNGVKLRYYLESKNSEKYNAILNNLSLYITSKYTGNAIPLNSLNSEYEKVLSSFLNLWTQRDLSLLEYGLVSSDIDENTDFNKYFINDDLANDTIEDVLDHYRMNGLQINNLKFRPAEIIVSDIFKTKFDRGSSSLYSIKKQGFKYFQSKMLDYYKQDDTEADIKIITSNLDKPIYIRFVDNLKRYDKNLNLRENFENGKRIVSRYNDQGNKIYSLNNSRHTSTIVENGKEIILIQTGTKIIGNSTIYHKTQNLEDILKDIIKSFKGSIKAMVPLMRDNSKINIFTYANKDGKSVISGNEEYDLNSLTYNQFKKFTGYNEDILLERGSIFRNIGIITENLSKIKYASWEKSHDIVASRIPAQSMQSFMPMRVVEYSDDSKNDAFVSISQIWLQGSDFDVDKAYLLGFSFDSKGKYSSWSNLTNFSTKSQIDAMEKLPMPTNKTLSIEDNSENIDMYYQNILNAFDGNTKELSSDVIEAFNSLIRFINSNQLESITSTIRDEKFPLELVVDLINKHNTDLAGISRSNSLKNGVVSKINRIISSPSNQLLANSPVTIDNWHNAVSTVINNKNYYIKEGITDFFNTNKDIQEIGDIHQYSRYLNTVFPSNRIEYRADNNKLETFKYTTGKEEEFKAGNGIYTTKSLEFAQNQPQAEEGYIHTVLINTKDEVSYPTRLDFLNAVAKHFNISEVPSNQQIEEFKNLIHESGKVLTFEKLAAGPETNSIKDNVHVLGSKIDLTKFKDFIEKEHSSKSKVLSPYDVISYYIQQHNASVGKDDVGIAANGIKAFFGLTDYYNHFYKTEVKNMSDKEILRSGKIFNKSFKFYDSTNSLKEYKVNTIADLQVSRETKERLSAILGDSIKYLNNNAALNLSGFLSGATDNAKELLMAKVNATTDLASVHIYLMVLGLNPEDVVEIMTSKVVSDIISEREGNLFANEYETSIDTIINNLSQKYRGDEILTNNLEVFKDLYYSSKELSALSGLFSVNQKRKADTWEIYKYLSRLEKVFNDSNKAFIGKTDVDKLTNSKINTLVKKLIAKNPLLVNDENYIRDIIIKASDITVKHKDYDSNIIDKKINLLRDGLDFRYYINDDNYKQIAKDYYNLIKYTFNVFDIVDSVPHFKGMVDSLVLNHNMLSKLVKKYNFVTNTLKDIITLGDSLVEDFSKDYIDNQVINKGTYLFDTIVIENWLHSISGKINFRIKDLMSLAGVNKYQIYLSNEAKNFIKEDGIAPTAKTIVSSSTDNPLITLDTAYGIAQFKRIFEDLILPIIQNNTESEFSDYLKVETVMTPFGERGSAVTSTFPLQELNNPIFIKQFQSLLNAFNFLDSNNNLKGIITNSVGQELKLRDLFFIYNLIVNNEKYGNKRLTPIFENYMQEPDSLGYDYIKYWSNFEFGSEQIINNTSDPNWREQFEDNVLFHIANVEGSVNINRKNSRNKKYTINNPHFTLISDISLSREQEQNKKNLYDTLRILKEKGFVINLKC